MIIRNKYTKLPVSVKLLSLPLFIFLTLWAAGTIGFGYFTRNSLEQTAHKKITDLALLLQQDLQQQQQLLALKSRWISEEKSVIEAVAVGDRALLLRTLLPIQASLELDLLRIINTNGQSLISSQQQSLNQVQDANINAIAQTGLEISGIIVGENAALSSLASFVSIKSSTQVLANLVIGVAIDDTLLQQFRGHTSMHLIVLQDNQVTASTLKFERNQPWPFSPADSSPTNIKIAGETYLGKIIELPSLDQTKLKIAVLKSVTETEQAERQLWFIVGSFGLLGSVLIVGVMFLGFGVTQSLSRRIQSLTQATQQLAQGNLTIRLPVDTQDEVGLLAQGFNQMTEQLKLRDLQLYEQMQQLETTLRELHRTQNQMVQSEKMSALGQMVAGVAHEINNPINFIYGNLTHIEQYFQELLGLINYYQHDFDKSAQLLPDQLDEVDLDFISEDLQKILQSMTVGANRIRDIVLSLRNFSRLDEAEFKPADIHEGIDNTLMILQHRFKAKLDAPAIEVVKNYGQLPLVECYPGYLNQVFMNLLTNAIDALEESTQQKTPEERHTQPGQICISTQIIDEHQAQIVIADNGLGISETVRSRIFDPFFTTKPVGKGTGLGLSISYQIVTEKHNGKIWCDSTTGKGMKFVMKIPISQPQPTSTVDGQPLVKADMAI
ncbi:MULTISPECIES: ATP-binding protein [unclassified Anabaena]|uniref:sensor histidine kinase n=1 Tax=unclassified Anabaena TaxID=2619674 RepID=UPI0039C6099E